MRFTPIIIVILTLMGCAAVGVPHTNDPYQKIKNSHAMMNQGRAIPAERFANEALKEFIEKGDKFGQGEANVVLGILYKSDLKNNNKKSIKHFKKAIKLFKSVKDNSQLAKAKFGLANAYALSNQKQKQCQMYNESLRDYKKGLSTNPKSKFGINHNFQSFEEMVTAYRDQSCS